MAPDATELFVAPDQPRRADDETKAAATTVPTRIAETDCHQLRP